jgi:hypothetical protein
MTLETLVLAGSATASEQAALDRNAAEKRFRRRLTDGSPDFFDRYPIAAYITLLDATPLYQHYHAITTDVGALWRDILDECGKAGLEAYNRLTMLTLIDVFETRAARHDYPDSIVAQFKLNFVRISKKITDTELGAYLHSDDLFLKDFAVCRQRLIPCGGTWYADPDMGYARAPLFGGGVSQFFEFLYFHFFVARGSTPFYLLHIHLDRMDGYNEAELTACHERLVELLERRPEAKGIFGSSWMMDPALGKVSPRHAFFLNQRRENGAWVFRGPVDIDGGALATSGTRQRAYAEGNYIPRSYLVVWTRDRMFTWSRKRAKTGAPGSQPQG